MSQNITKSLFNLVVVSFVFLAACAPVTPAGQITEDPPAPTETPSPEPPGAEMLTMYIDAQTVECVGIAPQQCLLVRYSEDGERQFFYDSIEGFGFEPGFVYEIKVNRYEVDNPPADASAFRYELVEIVSKEEAPAEEAPALGGTSWNLIGYGDPEALTPTVPGGTVTLDFLEGEDHQAGGQAACNFYGGSYTQEGNQFKWSDPYFAVTEMACEQELMAQEREFLELLVKAETLAVEGNRLTIHTPEGVLVFEQPEDAKLEGNDWVLIGIGGTRTYLDENITARFEDGRMSGSGGCNGYGTAYESDGKMLTFGPVESTLMACEGEIMDRESEFFSVLESVASYKIERNTLFFLDADGGPLMTMATGEIPEP